MWSCRSLVSVGIGIYLGDRNCEVYSIGSDSASQCDNSAILGLMGLRSRIQALLTKFIFALPRAGHAPRPS